MRVMLKENRQIPNQVRREMKQIFKNLDFDKLDSKYAQEKAFLGEPVSKTLQITNKAKDKRRALSKKLGKQSTVTAKI